MLQQLTNAFLKMQLDSLQKDYKKISNENRKLSLIPITTHSILSNPTVQTATITKLIKQELYETYDSNKIIESIDKIYEDIIVNFHRGWHNFDADLLTEQQQKYIITALTNSFKVSINAVASLVTSSYDIKQGKDWTINKTAFEKNKLYIIVFSFLGMARMRNNKLLKHWATLNTLGCIYSGTCKKQVIQLLSSRGITLAFSTINKTLAKMTSIISEDVKKLQCIHPTSPSLLIISK